MKTILFNQKKWILPSLLVATLAANTYYQSSSLYGSVDLASKDGETEASTAKVGVCKDGKCELSQDQFNELMNFVRATKEAKPTVKAKTEKEEDLAEKESASEKRERLAREKKEKIKEEFEAKVEKLSEKCDGKDLDCATSGLTSLLGRYTGTKKLDSSTVSTAYSKLLAKPIREALKNSDTDSLTALADLVNDIPKEYQTLRTKTLEVVKLDTQLKAQQVNNEFKLANESLNQKNPQGYQQHVATAQTNLQKLQQSTGVFVQTVSSNATYEQDNVTLNYLRENFDTQKLFANINNVGSFNQNQNNGQNQTGGQNQNNGQGSVQQMGTSTRQNGQRMGIPMQAPQGMNGQMGQQQPVYNNMNMNQNMFPQNQNMMMPGQQQYMNNGFNNGMNGGLNNGMNMNGQGYNTYNPMMPQQNQMGVQGGGVTFRGTRQ